MATGQGIRAGKAFVEFVLDDKRFKRELHSLRGAMLKVGAVGLAATAPIIAGFTGAAAAFANSGSELHDMSKQMGISVEMLSEMKYAAEQSGTSLRALSLAARQLQKKGISPARFFEVAESVAAIEDPVKRAQLAMERFGARSGTSLLPMLEDLPQLRAQFKLLGIGMSTQNAAAADALGDAFGDAKAQFTALINQVGAAIAGPLTDFLVRSQGVLAWTIEFIKQNPVLVQGIASLTAGIAAASVAALGLGAALTVLSANPIVIAVGAIGALALLGASKAGLFDGMVSLPKVASPVGARSGVSSAASRIAAGQNTDILKYSRQTAAGVNTLVRLQQRQGLIAGAG